MGHTTKSMILAMAINAMLDHAYPTSPRKPLKKTKEQKQQTLKKKRDRKNRRRYK